MSAVKAGSRITMRVPNTPDTVFAPEAVEGLVGQEPRLTEGFNHARPLGRGRVVAAEQDEAGLLLTVEVISQDPGAPARIEDAFRLSSWQDGTEHSIAGLGFRDRGPINEARFQVAEDFRSVARIFKDVAVREVSPAYLRCPQA